MARKNVTSKTKVIGIDDFITKHDTLEAAVTAMWTAEGLERDNTAYYRGITKFKKDVKLSQADVITMVDQVVRAVTAKGEFLFFDITQTSEDALGSTIQCNRRIGTVDEPIFKRIYQINPETGEKVLKEVAVTGQQPRFCIPFTKANLEILRPFMIDYCSFVLKSHGQPRYGGFTFTEFASKSAEELFDQGKYGTLEHRQKMAAMKAQREAVEKGSIQP